MFYLEARQQRIKPISLSGNQNTVPAFMLHATEMELPKPLMAFMKTPLNWYVIGVMALYDRICHSAFSAYRRNKVCKGWHLCPAPCCLHCSCMLLVEALPLFLCLHETAYELFQGENFIHFPGDTINGILLKCDKWNSSSIFLGILLWP